MNHVFISIQLDITTRSKNNGRGPVTLWLDATVAGYHIHEPHVEWIGHRPNRPYSLTTFSRHLRGKTVTKQSKCTYLYVRRTGLDNEQPPFDLYVRAPNWNDIMCIRSNKKCQILEHFNEQIPGNTREQGMHKIWRSEIDHPWEWGCVFMDPTSRRRDLPMRQYSRMRSNFMWWQDVLAFRPFSKISIILQRYLSVPVRINVKDQYQ